MLHFILFLRKLYDERISFSIKTITKKLVQINLFVKKKLMKTITKE